MVFTYAHCTHDVSAEDDDQTGADRVGGIPHRHFRSQLFWGDPVGQQSGTWGEAHTLQPAVCDPENTHKENQGIGKLGAILYPGNPTGNILSETEGEVCQSTESQADCHKESGIDPVGQHTVKESGNAVDQSMQGQEDTQTCFGDAQISFQSGHCKREVFPDEIEEGIPDHGSNNGTGLPIFEKFGYLRAQVIFLLRICCFGRSCLVVVHRYGLKMD